MEERIGSVTVIVQNRTESARRVNEVLGKYGDIVRGRMGIPSLKHNVCCISLIVEGTNEQIGAMTGQLGQIKDVKVSSSLIKK